MTLPLLDKLAEIAFLIALSPLLTGLIKKLKARLQCRRGPGLLQPYRDLSKLFRKGQVRSRDTTFVFRVVPPLALGATAAASALVPVVAAWPGSAGSGATLGDAILLLGLLALARFAMALGALDAGGAFGGMGAAREMTVGALAEPAMGLVIFGVALGHGTTDLASLTAERAALGMGLATAGTLLGFLAALIVLIAETGRIPFDNPDTHLELTMMHEGMILEHSGPGLGCIVLATHLRQALLMALVADLFFPLGIASRPDGAAFLLGAAAFLAKAIALAALLAVVESATAKVRFFHIPDLFVASAALGFLALIVRAL
jgi:formate hydrogenlyase subunit 4